MNKFIWTLLLTVFSFSLFAQKKGGNPNSVHIPQKGVQSEVESKFTKATGYFFAEKYEKSLNSYLSLLKKDKYNASIFFMISRCHLALNDTKNALKFGKKAISYPDSEREFFLYQSSLLQKNSTTANASQVLEQLFTQKKEKADDYTSLANLYRQSAIQARDELKVLNASNGSSKLIKQTEANYLSYLNKELKLYKQYSSTYPTTPEIHSKKINTLFILNMNDEAWQEGIKYINKNPEDLSLVYDHCTTFFKKFQQRSIALLEETTAKHPLEIENKLLLHDFYNQINQPQKASETILSVFHNPNFSLERKLRTTQSYLQTHTALHQKTAKEMMKIIKNQYPNSGIVYALEGDYYVSHLVLDSARLSFLKAIKHSPNTPELWEKVIRISLQNKEYTLLINDLDQAIAQNNESPILYYYKGFGHYNLKEYNLTVKALEQALTKQPTSELELQINHLLAESYYKNNQLDKAWNAYDDILLVTPNDPYTLNNYSYFLALEEQKLPQALSMSKTLMRLAPNEPNYIDTYAWVLYKNKKYKEALSVIEPIAITSTSAEVIEHYGDILDKTHNKKEALTQWKKALELDTENTDLIKKINKSETK